MSSKKETKQSVVKKMNHKTAGITIVIVVILSLILWLAFGYYSASKELKEVKKEHSQEQEIQELLSKVKKHLLINDTEIPIVATIQDIDKLKNEQSFYADAQNGQKVLIFSEKAVIYDEKNDILINVGPVIRQENINEDKKVDASSPLNIEIRNGSKVIGVAQDLSLKFDQEKYHVLAVEQAKNREYVGNLIVNISQKNIDEINNYVSGEITTKLPEGEKETNADILIILGNE